MEDRAFFFFRSSSAFLLASSSSLRAFSSCGVQHTEQLLQHGLQLPQQPVSVQGMWSEKDTDENWQLLFSALALRARPVHLWTEPGRTCSWSLEMSPVRCRDKEREAETLTASLAWRSFSFSARILCCSALSALRFSCREHGRGTGSSSWL